MAACGSLQHIFEKPLPENPTLLESLSSWNHIKSSKPIDDSSFTEIFGELHFRENPQLLPSSTFPFPTSYLHPPQTRDEKLDKNRSQNSTNNEGSTTKSPSSEYFCSSHTRQYHRSSENFSSMNSESLQLCTEGLGFESSGDVENWKADMNGRTAALCSRRSECLLRSSCKLAEKTAASSCSSFSQMKKSSKKTTKN